MNASDQDPDLFSSQHPAMKSFRSLTVLASLLVVCTSASAFIPVKANTCISGLFSTGSDTASMPEVKVGDKLPDVTMSELTADMERPVDVKLSEVVAGKKVAIFGVPGAFTPGCSKSHLPSFMEAQADLKGKGVELTICVATNDAFVMEVRMVLFV